MVLHDREQRLAELERDNARLERENALLLDRLHDLETRTAAIYRLAEPSVAPPDTNSS